MTSTTRGIEKKYNLNVVYFCIGVSLVLFFLGIFINYLIITDALKDVPRKVCHTESVETGYIVCSVASNDLKQVNITAFKKFQYKADEIDSVSVNVGNFSLPYDNCIPYRVEQEVCEIK